MEGFFRATAEARVLPRYELAVPSWCC